jgi:hypothetical protein
MLGHDRGNSHRDYEFIENKPELELDVVLTEMVKLKVMKKDNLGRH